MNRVFQLNKQGQQGLLPAMQSLLQTPHTMVVAFTVEPGQEVPQHIHPASDDMWIIVEGEGEYYVGEDTTEHVQAGMVACAPAGTVHGLRNTGGQKAGICISLGSAAVGLSHGQGGGCSAVCEGERSPVGRSVCRQARRWTSGSMSTTALRFFWRTIRSARWSIPR